MPRWIALALAVALAEVATAAAQDTAPMAPELAKALAGRTPGKSEDCISNSRVGGPEVIDNNNIIYQESRTRLWRNELAGGCKFLRENDILVIESYGNQICKLDRFSVINRNSGLPSAYCILGSFTPYDAARPTPKP